MSALAREHQLCVLRLKSLYLCSRLPLLLLLLLPGDLTGAGVKVDATDLINYSCSVHPE